MKVTNFGIRSAGNLNIDIAQGVDDALHVYNFADYRTLLSNYDTYVGDVGSSKDLVDKLRTFNMVLNMMSTSTVHDPSTVST